MVCICNIAHYSIVKKSHHDTSFLTHNNSLFVKSNLLNLQDIVNYQIVLFIYKIHNNL